MKIIEKNKNHNLIVLDDNDILEITTLKLNQIMIHIKCENGSLQIDDFSYLDFNALCEEQKAIASMKKYNKKKNL